MTAKVATMTPEALGGRFGFHDTALDLLFSGAKPRSVPTDLAAFERHLVPYFATDSVADNSAKKPSKTAATKRAAKPNSKPSVPKLQRAVAPATILAKPASPTSLLAWAGPSFVNAPPPECLPQPPAKLLAPHV